MSAFARSLLSANTQIPQSLCGSQTHLQNRRFVVNANQLPPSGYQPINDSFRSTRKSSAHELQSRLSA